MLLDILGFKFDQRTHWQFIATSNPKRVVHTLRTGRDPDSLSGDPRDVDFALGALMAAASQSYAENPTWTGLVAAGVIEVLCSLIIKKSDPQAAKSPRSRTYGYCEVLRTAANNFCAVPSTTDRAVLKELRENWSKLMKRFWERPDNSIVPGDEHIEERMFIPSVLTNILRVDPSFARVICDSSDLTFSVLLRQWMYIRAPETDISAIPVLVASILEPSLLAIEPLDISNPLPLPTITAKLMRGGQWGSRYQIYPRMTAPNIVSVFATHLRSFNGMDATAELDFLRQFFYLTHAQYPEFAVAVYDSASLWKSLAGLLRRAAKNEIRDTAGNKHGHLALVPIIAFHNSVLADALRDGEDEKVVRHWINGSFFDALDDSITAILAQPDSTAELGRILINLRIIIPRLSKKMRGMLQVEFPRPRIAHALLKKCTPGLSTANLSRPTISLLVAQSNIHWDKAAWVYLCSLTEMLVDENRCARRGCAKPSFTCCERCEEVYYCGEDCKTRDLDEHKLLCRWMPTYNSVMNPSGEQSAGREPYSVYLRLLIVLLVLGTAMTLRNS